MEDDSKTPENEETKDHEDTQGTEEPSESLGKKITSLVTKKDQEKSSRNSHRDGPIIYPNASALSRPLDMPPNVRRGLIFAVIAAAVIAIIFLSWYLDGVVNEPKRQQEAVTELLSKDVSYDLPGLYPLMPLDDADILATLQQSGLTLFEVPAKEGYSTYQLIKLPPDVSAVDAGASYLAGIENISSSEAAKLLNGSWDLQVNRENGTNMVLHYADFKSGTVDAAVQTALVAEGLTDTNIEESGEDSAGNTYVMGTIEGESGTYSWRVSALPLSEIYSVDGLPDNAVYVGIRMTS